MKHNDLTLMGINLITTNWFVTGSFLVNPDNANDIDIVLVHDKELEAKLKIIGFVKTNNDKYKMGGGAATIRSTWRKDDYNIIVVHDKTAAALWRAFSNIISNKDYAFVNKEDRIKLHELITKDYKHDFEGI